MTGPVSHTRLRGARAAAAIACAVTLVSALGLLAAQARATIAFEKDAASFRPSVWVAEDSGASPRQLVGGTGGEQPLIAPDGSAVIYQSLPAHGNAALEIVPVAGGASTVLAAREANMNNTAWSPDSKTIATTIGLTPERERLVLIDVATHSVRSIATGTILGVSWSPDSTQVAYSRAPNLKKFPASSDIYTVALASGGATRITNNRRSTNPVWGPAKIAFARTFKVRGRREDAPKSNVWLMNPNGSQPRQLTRQKAPFLLSGPAPLAWSASGAQLLAQFSGEDTAYGEGVNPLTGAVHRFSAKSSVAYQLFAAGISRDGTTVLASTGGLEPGPGHNVVTVPFAGGAPTVLVRNASSPSWNR
jgi:dipeptidyl aminopeptidase/acylaminoacyl peptidase